MAIFCYAAKVKCKRKLQFCAVPFAVFPVQETETEKLKNEKCDETSFSVFQFFSFSLLQHQFFSFSLLKSEILKESDRAFSLDTAFKYVFGFVVLQHDASFSPSKIINNPGEMPII